MDHERAAANEDNLPNTQCPTRSTPPCANSIGAVGAAANGHSKPAPIGFRSMVRLTWRVPLVCGAVIAAVSEPIVRRSSTASTLRFVQRWARAILLIAGVEVHVTGTAPTGRGLFVCNHRSYIDILALLSCLPVAFLCKREVATWPLIGSVASRMGALYVDRNDKMSRNSTIAAVVRAVRAGKQVLAFPEGTTYAGPGMGRLRPGLFRAAENGNFAVFPIVIDYDDPHDAWVGDDTLLRHAIWWLSKPTSRVRVSFGSPIVADAAHAPLHTRDRVEHWMRTELARFTKRVGSRA